MRDQFKARHLVPRYFHVMQRGINGSGFISAYSRGFLDTREASDRATLCTLASNPELLRQRCQYLAPAYDLEYPRDTRYLWS